LIEISLRGSQRRPLAGALRRRRKPLIPGFFWILKQNCRSQSNRPKVIAKRMDTFIRARFLANGISRQQTWLRRQG
jgi:hypothetical protein